MDYSEFKKKVDKGCDAWTEVLLFDKISSPLSYLLTRISTNNKLPFILTVLSFLLRMAGATLLLNNNLISGVVFICLGNISDGMDGRVSRFLFGKDKERRSCLDFLLDHLSYSFIYFSIYTLIYNIYNPFLLLIYILSYFMYSAFAATKFRLYAKIKHNPDKYILEGKTVTNPLIRFVNNVKNIFGKYRLVFHPSAVEGEFCIFILMPLFGFNIWLLVAALFCLWIDIFISGIAPVVLLLKENDI